MLRFYHSQPFYTVYPGGYSPGRSSYSSYPSSPRPLADPGMCYRRALAEYLSVEEEYKGLLRAREEARLRARVGEAVRRQKWARLLQAEIVRERRELQVREIELALAKTLSQAAPWKDYRIAPVIRQTSDQPLIYPLVTPYLHANAPGSPEPLRHFSVDKAQPQNDAMANTSDHQPPYFTSERVEESVPNLKSLLRERLQKAVGDGDDEVQDVARVILRHLAPVTGVSPPPASASSKRANTCSMQPTEGADLYRCDALQGAAAEAVKESFKAHRAEVAERDQCPASSPTFQSTLHPLNVIQDIRSALTKLSSGFTFPPRLDYSDDEPDGLAYTPTNAPVRVYQHALDNLLAQLDAVETDGDEEVRVVRRAAVKEVEKAIEDVEGRISEARGGGKLGSNVGAATPAEDDLAEDDKDEQVIHADASVDDDNRSEANGHSRAISSKDSLDLVPSNPDVSSLPNSEVVLPLEATLTSSEPTPDEGVLEDQSSSPGLEFTSQTAVVATPTVTPSGQGLTSPVRGGDPQGSKYEASTDRATTDQTTSACLEPSLSATPLESPTTVVLGAIAPSSTPVSRILPSPVNAEDMLAAFDHDLLSLSQGPESEDDSISVDTDDEREWIEVEP